MLVVTASAHRQAAFAAAEFLMDYLKTRAPFWKKKRAPTARALGRRAREETMPRSSAGDISSGRLCPVDPAIRTCRSTR